ncbi:MAG: hypothetical protein HYU64_05940 [Armatimonadetes bacterium]|nr:hypothetical protein [Armatimonadota bacterium]
MFTQQVTLNGTGWKGPWLPSLQVNQQKGGSGEIFQKTSQGKEPSLDAKLLQDLEKSESRSGDAAIFLLLMGLGFMAGGAVIGGLAARAVAGAMGATPGTISFAGWGGGVIGAVAGGKVFRDM